MSRLTRTTSASKHDAARRRIIAAVAQRASISTSAASLALDELFEQIRTEVSLGRVVSWPTLGSFGPAVRRVRSRDVEEVSLRSVPRFCASRSFQLQVRGSVPPNAAAVKRLRRVTVDNRPSGDLRPLDVSGDTTREDIRASIARQLAAPR